MNLQFLAKAIFTMFLACWAIVCPAADKRVEFPASLQQGDMVIGKAPPGSKVTLNDTALRQTGSGHFVFGLDRDASSGDVLKIVLPDGQLWQKELHVEPKEYNIQYVEGIDKKIMSKDKPPETWERIRKESAAVKAARADHYELDYFLKSFDWPLIGPITGVFGSQRVYNGEPGRPHYGVDVAAPVGTPVYAPQAGVVTLAYDDMYYSGGTIIIDHGFGISSSFLHLSKTLVKAGDKVEKGDLIAEVGQGGRASGAHLDWRMNWYKRRIDPQQLVPDMQTLLGKHQAKAQ